MVNRIILVGRFGKELELRHSAQGLAILNCSLAVNEVRCKDGEKKEDTQWFTVVAFGKLAENIHNLARKGSLVYVEGKLRTRSYEGKDGQKRSTTEVNADIINILEGFKNEKAPYKPPIDKRAALEENVARVVRELQGTSKDADEDLTLEDPSNIDFDFS